jgi:HEAT repeat protein
MPVAWQAEELLHYAAGEKTPNAVLGRGKPKERKTCQVAWESWLKTKGSLVDLKARQKQVQRPGLVLIFEGNTNWLEAPAKDELEPYWSKHIWLCGCEGQPRCNPYTYAEFSAKQLNRPRLRWLAFCGLGSSGVAVYAGLKKSGFSILWNPGREKELYHPDHPVRLENGNCMKIVEQDRFDSLYRVIEEDEKRRIVWESASTEELCALVVWPLVRVGFGRPAGGNMGLDTPVARLKALKHHPQAIVRRLAAERLRTYPSDKAICQAMVEALKDSDLGVQSQALCFLETAKPENIYPGIPRLVQLLCNPENGRLGNPGDVLERCGRKAIPELMKAFEDRKGPNATLRRSRAIMVLACLVDVPDPILHRTLKAAFEDEDPKVRMEVIWSLFGPQTKARRNYFPYLLSRLQDPNPKVVDTVLRKLGRLGEAAEAAVPDLTKLLNQHKYRDDAIFLLGAVGNKNPKVLPLILGQLKPGKESITYCSIASALGKYAGSKDASMIIPVLVKMLKEYPVNRVEKAVVSALEQFGPSAITAVPVLMRLINKRRDNDHILRALEKIDPATAEKTRTILYRKELEFEKAFKK